MYLEVNILIDAVLFFLYIMLYDIFGYGRCCPAKILYL
jgi:hypothetical protein